MDTRFVKTLLCVIDHGSFAEAARIENLTAAAVAQRVRSLESDLRHPLMERSGQRVHPTRACIALLPRFRHIVSQVSHLTRDLEEGDLQGDIRLGAISTVLSDRLPDLLNAFSRDAPKAQLSVTPGSSEALFQKLMKEELDAAFMIQPPQTLPKALQMEVLETQRFVAIAPREDDRALSDLLSSERALVYDLNSWGGRIIKPWVTQHIPRRSILCEVDALEAIAFAVSQGIGFGIVPDWHGLARMEGLRRLPLPGDPPRRTLSLVHRGLGKGFLDLLRAVPRNRLAKS